MLESLGEFLERAVAAGPGAGPFLSDEEQRAYDAATSSRTIAAVLAGEREG